VAFVRSPGMLPLPEPDPVGSLDLLQDLIGVDDPDDWMNMIGWLVGVLNPDPHDAAPILMLLGGEGTGKTTRSRMLRSCVDPNVADARSLPRNERDFMIGAHNSLLQVFDNISSLNPAQADMICRLATGGAIATRELYANLSEVLINVKRPVLMNGITRFTARPDFLDRAMAIELPRISDGKRRDERELWGKFEDALPRILGGLYNAVACALRELPKVPKDWPWPRMIGFAKFVTAAESALGCKPGAFLAAYRRNRDASALEVATENPLAAAVIDFVNANHGEWGGTATALLQQLKPGEIGDYPKSWPQAATQLSKRLKRLEGVLLKAGVEVSWPPRAKERRIELRWVERSGVCDSAPNEAA
jgi:putative DNA primase/helicase